MHSPPPQAWALHVQLNMAGMGTACEQAHGQNMHMLVIAFTKMIQIFETLFTCEEPMIIAYKEERVADSLASFLGSTHSRPHTVQ